MSNPIDEQVEARRKALGDATIPGGADHKWGLALSGGGIRSATFCLGLLRALARHETLLRFDLISTVSGGGYIGSMVGSLFNRATSSQDARRVQDAVGNQNSGWFLWWLRANGRYLIPSGARDRTFAIALFLRNLSAVHFELGLMALLLGLCLAALDMLAWWGIGSIGYAIPTNDFFGLVRWLPSWLPVIWLAMPLIALVGAVYAVAYWAEPWVQRAHGPGLVGTWIGVLVVDVFLATVFYYFGNNSSDIGDDLRTAFWWLISELITIWLVATLVASHYLCKVNQAVHKALQGATARNLLTRRLASCFRLFAAIAIIGLIDRVSWSFAFEWDGLASTGVYLALVAALLRAILPSASSMLGRRGAPDGLLAIGHLLGYAVTFLLCAWWVSLVHKAVMGTMFTAGSVQYDDGIVALVLLAVPVVGYVILTGRNFAFLNLSSLHSFYKSRLTRSYLGAANGRRFGQSPPLGALDKVPNVLPTTMAGITIDDVRAEDDASLEKYRPQRAGGPIHLINVCVNQTRDPRGGLFNQDRRGLPLTVASGGLMQTSQEGWKPLIGKASLSVGTWMAISGAAVAPGLGSLTRGGIAALATFAGVRLGYWWSRAERTNVADSTQSPPLAKSRGLLNEMSGVFQGTEGPDWFLTDGGHFENTGAYALLAERAKVIILADCGADPQYAFCDLENLVRKARIDLQAEIYFQRPKVPDRPPSFGSLNDLASPTGSACLALARIVYGGDRPSEGILIVVKPNLCDGLPVDLVNFKAQNPDFPQQTTADQFFSEAQWESYFLLGQFMGRDLSRQFIKGLLSNAGNDFETDECSPFDAPPGDRAAPIVSNGAANGPLGRLPSRFAATAVGTTIGLGAAATIGVSAWQAIDSVRADSAKQRSDERTALKELTELWEKLPVRQASGPLPDSAAVPYGNLAAALVRTADTLCPSKEAGWFIRSPLAARISQDGLRGCRALEWKQRTEPCHVLVEAANPNIKSALPNCLAWEDARSKAVPPPRYWAYDFQRTAQRDDMHPCDPLRAELASDEARHVQAYGPLTDRQDVSNTGLNGDAMAKCHSAGSDSSARSGSLDRSSPSPRASASPPPLPAASAPAEPSPGLAGVTSPGVLASGAMPAPAASGTQAASSPVPVPGDACKGTTVYVQIYDGAQRDTVRTYREPWRAMGASVPPIEDVVDTAQRAGRATPMPVRETTVRYHDSASIACARALGPAVGFENWVVESLSAKLKPSRRTVEVWVAPASGVGKK
ncbi:patatin-like phospholipase family protein [Cupriavidus lacunae]|nr:patatin-like phospholipase family protein [Cupriavidus lacunae]